MPRIQNITSPPPGAPAAARQARNVRAVRARIERATLTVGAALLPGTFDLTIPAVAGLRLDRMTWITLRAR
jgi:hypothetical protein